MANGLINPPFWGASLSFPNNYHENSYNIETQCSGNGSCIQTNSLMKPKVFSPVVIYQTSHGSSSRETSERSSRNGTQIIPSVFNHGVLVTKELESMSNTSTQEDVGVFYWNNAKQNIHRCTLCENGIVPGHSMCKDFSVNVLKWRDYTITQSYDTLKYNLKETNKHVYYQPTEDTKRTKAFHRSAFRRPSRKSESMKCYNNVNDDGVVTLSESLHRVTSQNTMFSSSSNADGCLIGCFQNRLPIPNAFSSTMNSLSHFPFLRMEDTSNYFALELDNASKIKHLHIEQSLVSNVVSGRDQQDEGSLEISKESGSSCSSRGKKHTSSKSANRPFKCQCGSMFARNEELTRHQRIHSGYKPHLCHICCKRFGRKDHLNKHVKTHLHSSEKKVHLCDFPNCGQMYTRSDALARHQMNSHGIKAKPSKWRPQMEAQ